MQNKELDIEKVISVQESINPDLTIPLDYPFLPKTPEHIMSGLWDRTANNITYWQESTSLKGRLVPSLHSWDKTSLKKNLAWLQKHADTNLIALGSIVDSSFAQFEGIFGDRQPTKELVDMVSFALSVIEKESDFSVHLMGWGSSPLMLHLGYYLGMKSMDTMGYRRKAAFGKIVLPGRGERHIGETSSVFGGRQLNGLDTPGDLALLQDCKCPICQSNQLLLLSDWKARAIHNEWVMKQEARTAESFLEIGRDVYEKYLDKAVFATSSLQYLWDYTKLRVKYHRISDTLFG
jgi:queuine/archaeosine tRNA-ribosyltransferase